MTRMWSVWLVLLLSGCAKPAWQRQPFDQIFQRTGAPHLHKALDRPYFSDLVDKGTHAVLGPLGHALSPGYYLRKVVDIPARDVNAFGQVPDSPWFKNRIGRRPMSLAEFIRGPNRSGKPKGSLLVLHGKNEGATPGLEVRDQAGVRWIIKFDPPAFPNMASGAEFIATKALHAAGYHVPENYLLDVDLERFRLDPAARTRDKYGSWVPLTQQRLIELIRNLNPRPDGKVRALASRVIEGIPVGRYAYEGIRKDDPNDRIAHQNRRSLRGLWVFAAWLNDTDVRKSNTLDVFVPMTKDKRLGYIKHYLIDFNAALGSDVIYPKPQSTGYAYRIDWRYAAARLFTLGLFYPYYLAIPRNPFRSIGTFEAKVFSPKTWRPDYPNPAFDHATPQDTYWAAAILARITAPMIRALVKTGGYSERGAEDWLFQVLLERRRKLLRHAFEQVLPLDDIVIVGDRVKLTDLAVTTGLVRNARYAFALRDSSGRLVHRGTTNRPEADLSAIWPSGQTFAVLRWQRVQPDSSPALELRLHRSSAGLRAVGLLRATR